MSIELNGVSEDTPIINYSPNSIDEYIRLNSKYSILFRSSTFITLGLETNIFKKILKKII